ncbi:MAG: filamentous hemagglutinin N-terminal domain-containing protein [Methylococcales bacterium]
MDHTYHSIWNEALGAWVAVSEISSSNRRKNTKDWQSFTPLLATGLLVCSNPVWALPTGSQLVAGQATVSTPNANQMQIDQTSQKVVINWQDFSVQQHETVTIQQPNANAALLNRVVGQDASQIQGQIKANGQVYIVNPNGVVFGKNAQVDVGGLVATTHNINDADFMVGKNHFAQDGAKGSVENHGTIKTPEGGVVALIGEKVTNTGSINTPKGTTVLAAGKTVDLDFKGDGLVEVKVSEAVLNAQIANKGAIQADGGRVVLTAKAAGKLMDTVINQDGIVRAQGMVERNGEIILEADTVVQTGTLDASGKTGGTVTVNAKAILDAGTTNADGATGSGGKITLTASDAIIQTTAANTHANGKTTGGTVHIEAANSVYSSGKLSATGEQGGTIRVNGNFHSAKTKLSNTAKTTAVNSTTHLTADRSDTGITHVSGTLDASGNGVNKTGGKIVVTGDNILIDSTAKLSATGVSGGGDILVGGSWKNSDTSIRQANTTVVKQGAVLDTSATDNGKGGTVVVWSNVQDETSATRVQGTLLAKGGLNGGDGGRIETSGHWLNTDNIKVDASSPHGNSGLWLLDPWNVIIGNISPIGTPFANPFSPTQDSTILATDIEAALNTGSNVTITTGLTGTSAGDITVNSSIAKTLGTSATLTLAAANAIIINSSVGISSTSNALNVILNADADSSGAGNIQMQAGSSISTNGGNIIMGGGACTALSCSLAATGYDATSQFRSNGIIFNGNSNSSIALNSSGGNMWLQGQGINDPLTGSSAAAHDGIDIFFLNLNSGGGNISFQGTGGSGITNNRGINVDNSSLLSQGGVMALNGNGAALATGQSNIGIGLFSATLNSGIGAMTLNGNGGGGTDLNYGVYIGVDSTTGIASSLSATSTLNITGTGGAGFNSSGIGLASTLLSAGVMNLTGIHGISAFAHNSTLGGSRLSSTDAMTLIGLGSGTGNSGIALYSTDLNSGGTMTLDGNALSSANSGVYIGVDPTARTASRLSTPSNLNIHGVGGSISGTNNSGIGLASALLNTGGGMTLFGEGTGINNYGISTSLSSLSSANGLLLTGTSLNTFGLFLDAGSNISNRGQSGAVTLRADTTTGADSIFLSPTASLTGTGNLFLLPVNSATTIGLAGGAGTFNLDATELATIANGFSSITIGNQSGTGLTNVGTWAAPSSADLTIFGNGITQTGILTIGSGKNLVLVSSGNYTNTFGSTAINVSGGGRALIYSTDPRLNNRNGLLAYFNHYTQPYTGITPSYASSGNWFFYGMTPVLTVTPNSQTITYGGTPANFGSTLTGFIGGDTVSTSGINGSALFGIDNFTGAIGSYNVAYLNGLASSLGYLFVDNTGSINELTVIPPVVQASIVEPPVIPIEPVIQVDIINSNFLLSQTSLLQQSTIFLPLEHEKLANDDEDTLDIKDDGMKLPPAPVISDSFNTLCQNPVASIGGVARNWMLASPASMTAFVNLGTLFNWVDAH